MFHNVQFRWADFRASCRKDMALGEPVVSASGEFSTRRVCGTNTVGCKRRRVSDVGDASAAFVKCAKTIACESTRPQASAVNQPGIWVTQQGVPIPVAETVRWRPDTVTDSAFGLSYARRAPDRLSDFDEAVSKQHVCRDRTRDRIQQGGLRHRAVNSLSRSISSDRDAVHAKQRLLVRCASGDVDAIGDNAGAELGRVHTSPPPTMATTGLGVVVDKSTLSSAPREHAKAFVAAQNTVSVRPVDKNKARKEKRAWRQCVRGLNAVAANNNAQPLVIFLPRVTAAASECAQDVSTKSARLAGNNTNVPTIAVAEQDSDSPHVRGVVRATLHQLYMHYPEVQRVALPREQTGHAEWNPTFEYANPVDATAYADSCSVEQETHDSKRVDGVACVRGTVSATRAFTDIDDAKFDAADF